MLILFRPATTHLCRFTTLWVVSTSWEILSVYCPICPSVSRTSSTSQLRALNPTGKASCTDWGKAGLRSCPTPCRCGLFQHLTHVRHNAGVCNVLERSTHVQNNAGTCSTLERRHGRGCVLLLVKVHMMRRVVLRKLPHITTHGVSIARVAST